MAEDPSDLSDPTIQKATEEGQHLVNLQYHQAQFDALRHVTELVDAIRRAQDLEDYRRIQQRLAEHIKRVEDAVGDANRRLAHADRRRRRLQRRENPPAQVVLDEVEVEHRQAEFDRELHLRLARQYRCLGDAMAWQLYDFQTLYINALGMNDSPGLIAQKLGASAEEEEIERYWREEGAFALRHDLTNCLRVWDLSVFYPGRFDLTQIVEVKGGDNNRVRGSQRMQATRAKELVQQRVTTVRDGTLLIHHSQEVGAQDELLRTNFQLLAEAIRQAYEEGVGRAANSYLSVSAIDLLDVRVTDPDTKMRERLLQLREPPAELMATPCPDYLVSFSDQRLGIPRFGAPYTIYPMPPNLAAAVVTGYLRLVFHLNLCVLIEAFRKAGFGARFVPPQKVAGKAGPEDYFLLQRGANTIKIGANVIEQMLFEGLTVDDLIASVSREFRLLEARHSIIIPAIVGDYQRRIHVLTTFMGLEEIWRASRQLRLREEPIVSTGHGESRPESGGTQVM